MFDNLGLDHLRSLGRVEMFWDQDRVIFSYTEGGEIFFFMPHCQTFLIDVIKIAHWADEFSTDAFGEMLAIICKWRSSQKKKSNSEF